MLRLLFVAVVACLALAQDDPTPAPEAPPAAVPETILMYVQQEEAMARSYLEVLLRLQHAQYSFIAGNYWSYAIQLEMKEDDIGGGAGAGFGNRFYSFEEDNIFHDVDDSQGAEWQSLNDKEDELDLLASYNLFRAINVKQYQTVFQAGDVQKEFFMDRALQYYVQAGGDSIAPQLYQVLYLKMYGTMLKTMRLSYAFQYLSHFRTWLEDQLDLDTVLVSNSAGASEDQIIADAADDIIRDKMYAFHAYHTYASLDFQIFYIDSYLEYMFTSMAGGSAPPAASFLEEESINPGSLGSMAMGSLGAGSMASNPVMFLKLYKFYHLYLQMNAASSAYMSVNYEKQAYGTLNDGIESNDASGEEMKTYAQHMFAGYAKNMQMSAYLEQIMAYFELYTMYAPAVAGSLGGSAGSSVPASK